MKNIVLKTTFKTKVKATLIGLVISALSGCVSSQNDSTDLSSYTGNTSPASLNSTNNANIYVETYNRSTNSLAASDVTNTRTTTNRSFSR